MGLKQTPLGPHERSLSGLPAEEAYGYCRGVKVGGRVIVSGMTAAVPGGGVAPEHEGDTYAQAKEALRRVGLALADFGLTFANIIKTTVYFTEIDAVPHVVKAHGEAFGQTKPASTAVCVVGLFTPGALIEIEAEAIE